jgi:hypothetical protein
MEIICMKEKETPLIINQWLKELHEQKKQLEKGCSDPFTRRKAILDMELNIRNNAFMVQKEFLKMIAEASMKLEQLRAGYATRGLNKHYPPTESGQLQRVGDLLEASLKERTVMDLDENGFIQYYKQAAEEAEFLSLDLCKRLYKRKLKTKDMQKRFEQLMDDTCAQGITGEEKIFLQNIKHWNREVEAFTIYLDSLKEQETEVPCTQAQEHTGDEVAQHVG